MDSLAANISIAALGATLILVHLIYQSASIEWKTRPWIPLVAGVVVLLLGYGQHVWITQMASEKTAAAVHMTSSGHPKEAAVLMALALADERIAKLLELVQIPIAVSLIASSLFARADHVFNAKVNEYDERYAELEEREREIEEEDDALGRDLAEGVRGQGVIDRWKQIRLKRLDLFDAREDLQDDFRGLIDARLVRGSVRKPRRRNRGKK